MAQDELVNQPLSTEDEASATSSVGHLKGPETKEIDLLNLVTLLLSEKRTIFRFVGLTLLLGIIVAYVLMRPVYTAEAMFLPPQTSPGSGLSQIAGQLGVIGGMGALAGLKNPADIYIGILGSRSIADSLIEKYNLQKVYKTKDLTSTRKALKSASKFIADKGTLITISVTEKDPQLATDLANGYLTELRIQNGHLALTEASQRRLYFEEQLEKEKDALADAEVALKKTQESTGLIAPFGQAQVEIESMAQVRADISSREVALASLLQGATPQNPEVVRLQSQIEGLRQHLKRMENGTSNKNPGNIQVPTAKVPEASLEFIRKQREVKYHEVLFELIAKQYEAARLDEAKEAPVLQIVDNAILPDRKSGPPRMMIVMGSCLLGAIAGIVWVLGKAAIEKMKMHPSSSSKLASLRRAASFSR